MDHDTKAFVARFEAWPSLTDEAEDAGWKLTLTKDRRYAVLVQGGMGIKSNERITRKCSAMVVRGRGRDHYHFSQIGRSKSNTAAAS